MNSNSLVEFLTEKRRFFIYLAIILVGVLLIIGHRFYVQQQVIPGNKPEIVVEMLPSTLEVDPKLEAGVANLLNKDAVERGIYKYAITDVAEKDNYFYVSVAGLPENSTEMRLREALWLGVVTVVNLPGYPGIVESGLPTEQAPIEGESNNPGMGIGGSQNILPFRSSTTATYGVLGVHDCGYSLNGWKAVDLFPVENMVYSVQPGSVNFVCRDDTQVSLRIGNNLYAHLVDTGQQIGDGFSQGQAIAGLVPGSYDAPCGYAAQTAENYHVHFCFIPSTSGAFSADGYDLSIYSGNWIKGGETVEPVGILTANWQSAGVTPPGPTSGANFWDSMVSGVVSMATNTVNGLLPEHQDMGMAAQTLAVFGPALELVFLVTGFFDLRVILWVMGIVTTMETVRIAYAIYMFFKNMLPPINIIVPPI